MSDALVIPARYNGPPGSANGGYACGAIARALGGAAEVTLRRPPPLERPLAVHPTGVGVEVRDGDVVVAEAVPGEPTLDPPPSVSAETAERVRERYAGFVAHPFPTCFVCGPHRPARDGLAIFPGPVGDGVVAATWQPSLDLAGPDRGVQSEYVWAALDCPGAWSWDPTADPAVLGRLTVRQLAPVRAGERYVVLGWPVGRDGRKRWAGTALYDEGGALAALGRATWIATAS